MSQRDRFVAEMKRMEEALTTTKSKRLKNDYIKGLKKMRRELKEYDRLQAEAKG